MRKTVQLSKIIAHFCSMHAIKRLIPNLFTAGNLVGGILAIIFTLTGRIDLAPYCIFASAIFDFLDGFMARLLKVPSEMGKQLDSLADMVTFGVAPGIIVLVLLSSPDIQKSALSIPKSPVTEFVVNSQLENYGQSVGFEDDNIYTMRTQTRYCGPVFSISLFGCLGLIIPVFALFRLANFNIDTRQSESFIGLPTPGMTLLFGVLPLLFYEAHNGILLGEIHLDSWQFIIGKFLANPWVLITLTITFSILMVVELPLFALKFKHFKFKGNEIRYIFLTLSVLLLATLFFWAIPLIIILYVILSLINTQIKKNTQNEIQSGN
jgi:CDP-diacylglycerol--serine O-phosphatidyltransferase